MPLKRSYFIYLVITILSIACAYLIFQYGRLSLEVAFAKEQIGIFETMKTKGADQASLEYVMNYYPSGTKQRTGTPLDKIVETARSNAMIEIKAHLHSPIQK